MAIQHAKTQRDFSSILLGGVLIKRNFLKVDDQLTETDIRSVAVILAKLVAALDSAIKSVQIKLPTGIKIKVEEVEHVETHFVGGAIFLTNKGGSIEPAQFATIAARLKSDCNEWLAQALRERAGLQHYAARSTSGS